MIGIGMNNVIVIGGGAAGMMAAYAAAMEGARVTLLEKNEKLGKKLFITGKGRCNVCNAAKDIETLFENVCTNKKFLYSAFYGFDNFAMMELLEKGGCRLKVERGDRVFPVSDHSSDVIAAMKRLLDRAGVRVRLHATVKEILEKDGCFESVILQSGERITGDTCILCTGGVSYPTTGSTGDGYVFAERLGHELTQRHPALVPLETKETWPEEVMGLSLKNVSLKMTRGKKTLYEGFGEMMFTHFGVTGPLVLSASSFYFGGEKKEKNPQKKNGKELADAALGEAKREETRLWIDLKPALDEEQLDRRLLREFEENKAKQFKNALGALFPSKLIPIMIRLSGIDPEKKVSEIGKEERMSFGRLIKSLPLTVKGTRDFAEAIITQGGVSVKQVNPSTMESKLINGLYFAGEVLDLDALTGGFNLQIAWSTGWLAGKSAAEATKEAKKEKTEEVIQENGSSNSVGNGKDQRKDQTMSYTIAIDGPAGAGKSTIAKLVAKEKGLIYVDTGAMYRAMALYMLRNQVDPEDKDTIIQKCAEANVTLGHEDGQQVVYLNGENVNGLIRTEEVGNMASTISVIGEVRSKLVEKQQALAKTTDLIMDGRDIGTCVLPNANLKIYLTASSEVRAKRRYDELIAKGQECDLMQIQKDIEERDYRDMHRDISPLKQADDAILVDTSYLTIEEVVAQILSLAGR